MSFFVVLSIFGALVGIFMVTQGMWGDGMGGFLTLTIGIFFTIKEIIDMLFAGG